MCEELEEVRCGVVEQVLAEHEEEEGAEGVGLRRDLQLQDREFSKENAEDF